MVIGTAFGLHNAATVVLSVVLAFVFGYGLTGWSTGRTRSANACAVGNPTCGASRSASSLR
jgi:hypothetical protein